MERDELLNGLLDTQKLMEEIVMYNNKIKNQNYLIAEKEAALSKPDKKMLTKKTVIIGLFVMIWLKTLGVVLVVGTPVMITFLRKKKKEQMANELELQKIESKVKINEIRNEMAPVQEMYNMVSGDWYPQDYSNLDACTFFISALKNYRANTVTEMVNLYEDELHKNKVVQTQEEMVKGQVELVKGQEELVKGQQQMIGQQKLGNMLQVGNMAMQSMTASAVRSANSATVSAINSNTSSTVNAINNNTSATSSLHNTIKNARR